MNDKIKKFSEVKNSVKRMIILLHRRIIDAKERLDKMDAKKYNLKRSWYELSLKYDIGNKNKKYWIIYDIWSSFIFYNNNIYKYLLLFFLLDL